MVPMWCWWTLLVVWLRVYDREFQAMDCLPPKQSLYLCVLLSDHHLRIIVRVYVSVSVMLSANECVYVSVRMHVSLPIICVSGR